MSLALRLRICLVLCLISIGIAIYSEWADLNLIEAKTVALSERTVPALEQVAHLSDYRGRLEALLTRTKIETDPRELLIIEHQAQQIGTAIKARFTAGDLGAPRISPDSLKIFTTIAKQQREIVQIRADIVELTESAIVQLRSLERAVLIAQSKFGRLSEQFDLATGRRTLDRARTLGELSSSLAALLIITRDVQDGRHDATVNIRASVVAQTSAFVTRLARLDTHSARRDMAVTVQNYRALMLENGGAVWKLSQLQAVIAQQNQAFDVARTLLARDDDWTQLVVSGAARDFQQSAEQTTQIVRRIRLVDMMFNLTMLLITLGVLWFMIERRIIQRLTRLAAHIRAISQGRATGKLLSAGSDEITAVEHAVEQSRMTRDALVQSNEELQRFAYVAAHDLRAPLRSVSNLVEWMVEDYSDQLPDEARTSFSLIHSRVERLSGHLSALLDYARAGQIEGSQTRIYLDQLVHGIQDDFAIDPNFDLLVDPQSASFLSYATPVKTMLVNLITNAIKHHDQDSGVVQISSDLRGDVAIISVKDDGPGIPAEYQAKVFVLFQTLRSRDQVEGSGLGLALVQKICRSLGGRIELRSDPGRERGAEFLLFLPCGTKSAPSDLNQLKEAA